jgi:hypothetical protein
LTIAQQIRTQDNRSTSTPYLFQIQTPYKVWDNNLNGDHKVIINLDDFEEIGPFTKATIEEFIVDASIAERPDWVDGMDDFPIHAFDYEEWFDKHHLRVTSYSIAYKLENGFLTESACHAHIEGNRHHYESPKSYLSHCFRNPELATVFELMSVILSPEVVKS